MQEDCSEQQKRMGRLAPAHGGKVQNRSLRNRGAVAGQGSAIRVGAAPDADGTGDDYLTASEIACLKLDADSRSGNRPLVARGTEPLSVLRAFLYAGPRS